MGENESSIQKVKRRNDFPSGIFLAIVICVCGALALSAAHGYFTLSELRLDYLRNRGAEIARTIDLQVRGPGRRNNPAQWQNAIDENLANYAGSVAFLSLTNSSGKVLAANGDGFASIYDADTGFTSIGDADLFVVSVGLMTPRQMPSGMSGSLSGWRLHIGLLSSSVDFIRRQAIVHTAVTGVAIVTLLVLSYYFLHLMRSHLALQAQQESERRLAAIGTLAATLAHEIRNPLGAMKGLTQLAQEKFPTDHEAQALMHTVVSEAERLEQLVTNLLAFARPQKPEIRRLDITALVQDVHLFLQKKLASAGVRSKLQSATDSIEVDTDEHGLRQVLLNVLLNAVEAMPHGGNVNIEIRKDLAHRLLVLVIDDEGPGLGDRDPEELFQPFATTKTSGTGLGLAVSRRIIERLGGSITIGNRTPKGARCEIHLPITLK